MEKSLVHPRLVFICGSHRSGTSLLFNVLKNHPRVGGTPDVPEDPHPELHFFDAVYAYRRCFLRSLRKRAHALYAPLVRAQRGRDMSDTYTRKIEEAHTARDIFVHTAQALATKTKVDFLVEKTPVNIFFIPIIRRLFPEATFIFVLRDGREVCASAHKKWSHLGTNPVSLLARWSATLRAYEKFLAGRPHIFMRYEDLTTEPELSLQHLFDQLGLTFDSMFLKVPITSSFSGREVFSGIHSQAHYHEFFSKEERYAIEGLIHGNLVRYGYTCEFNDVRLTSLQRLEYLKCYSKHTVFFGLARHGFRCFSGI